MTLRPSPHLHQHFANTLVTPPSVDPVTMAELKERLVITDDSENDMINAFALAAIQYIERMTGIALITQTWKLTLDHWPTQNTPWWDGVRDGAISELFGSQYAADVELPRFPLQSVSSVTVYDEDGTSTAVTIADVFDVDAASSPGRITLKHGATWPVALRANNAIEIQYIAGYGDAATDVPPLLKTAILQMAAYLYSHRGDDCEVGDAYMKSGAQAIASMYKVARV